MLLKERRSFKLTQQELQKYAGVFDLDSISIAITMQVKNDELWAQVPGQGDFQLVPVSPGTFSVKNMSGYEVVSKRKGTRLSVLYLFNRMELLEHV